MWEEGSTLFSLDGSPMQKAPTVSVFGIKKKKGKKSTVHYFCRRRQCKATGDILGIHRVGGGGGEERELNAVWCIWFSTVINIDAFMKTFCSAGCLCAAYRGGRLNEEKGKKAAGMRLIYAICLENHRVSTVFPPDNPASLMCALINPPPVFDP